MDQSSIIVCALLYSFVSGIMARNGFCKSSAIYIASFACFVSFFVISLLIMMELFP